jgi:hypothetical protein
MIAIALLLAQSSDAPTACAAGGGVEELRAVLGLAAAQLQELRGLFGEAEKEYAAVLKTARERGFEAARDAGELWKKKVQDGIRKLQAGSQTARYDGWLALKARLALDRDLSALGLPAITELKIRCQLGEEPVRTLAGVAREHLKKLRKKLLSMHESGARPEEIALALNSGRREAVEEMIDAAGPSTVKPYVQLALRSAEERLSAIDRDRLERIMRQLAMDDAERRRRTRILVAATILHEDLRLAVRRELTTALLTGYFQPAPAPGPKSVDYDAAAWTALYEFGTLYAIHGERIASLQRELRDALSTRQIAKLVAERVLD